MNGSRNASCVPGYVHACSLQSEKSGNSALDLFALWTSLHGFLVGQENPLMVAGPQACLKPPHLPTPDALVKQTVIITKYQSPSGQ